ncbi:hypothetical protein HQ544_00830 [Candidatus Falkowbacteria bacterium]|nr:hypothetical protein [Candidatus Falkowbacteria bacterium]
MPSTNQKEPTVDSGGVNKAQPAQNKQDPQARRRQQRIRQAQDEITERIEQEKKQDPQATRRRRLPQIKEDTPPLSKEEEQTSELDVLKQDLSEDQESAYERELDSEKRSSPTSETEDQQKQDPQRASRLGRPPQSQNTPPPKEAKTQQEAEQASEPGIPGEVAPENAPPQEEEQVGSSGEASTLNKKNLTLSEKQEQAYAEREKRAEEKQKQDPERSSRLGRLAQNMPAPNQEQKDQEHEKEFNQDKRKAKQEKSQKAEAEKQKQDPQRLSRLSRGLTQARQKGVKGAVKDVAAEGAKKLRDKFLKQVVWAGLKSAATWIWTSITGAVVALLGTTVGAVAFCIAVFILIAIIIVAYAKENPCFFIKIAGEFAGNTILKGIGAICPES